METFQQPKITGLSAITEATKMRDELARAMRVVKAARGYKADDSHDDTLSLNALLDAVEEWEAGR